MRFSRLLIVPAAALSLLAAATPALSAPRIDVPTPRVSIVRTNVVSQISDVRAVVPQGTRGSLEMELLESVKIDDNGKTIWRSLHGAPGYTVTPTRDRGTGRLGVKASIPRNMVLGEEVMVRARWVITDSRGSSARGNWKNGNSVLVHARPLTVIPGKELQEGVAQKLTPFKSNRGNKSASAYFIMSSTNRAHRLNGVTFRSYTNGYLGGWQKVSEKVEPVSLRTYRLATGDTLQWPADATVVRVTIDSTSWALNKRTRLEAVVDIEQLPVPPRTNIIHRYNLKAESHVRGSGGNGA